MICLAPGYKKYDLYAVSIMNVSASLELWKYGYYESNTLYLEAIFKQSKNKLQTKTQQQGFTDQSQYSFDSHIKDIDSTLCDIMKNLREYILELDDTVEEIPLKLYIAYKSSKNFVCCKIEKRKIILFLKINMKEMKLPSNARDLSGTGHWGTGDFELSITNEKEAEEAKDYIKISFENIGA